jgi:1,4-dihydroxy-2-naphthoate octaprenyltransferase
MSGSTAPLAVSRWLKASRLPSQSYIAPPLLLGQAWVAHQHGELSWTILILVQAFGVFDQLCIVYANDYADQATDRLNRTSTLFSGGSRVLVEGLLQPRQLRRAALLMAGLCLLVGLILSLGFDRPAALPLAATALILLWAYSFAPLRLNYRGGGELLQAVGVGAVLPLFGHVAQGGALEHFPWPLLAVLLPTHLACAMATALPDEPSDRLSRKRTAAVLLGPGPARATITLLDLAGILAFTRVGWLPARDPAGGLALGPGNLAVLGLPAAATLAQPLCGPSAPGSRRLAIRVFLAILVTVSLTCGLTASLLWGGATS